jgi:hypothetical protein
MEEIDRMVRVLVLGEHAVALRPVWAALAGLPGVEPLRERPLDAPDEIDAVVMDQSLGALPAGGLEALAEAHPEASLVVVALQHHDHYRWLRVLPRGTGYAVTGAGTNTLRFIMRDLVRALGTREDPGETGHAIVPTMPRSIA